LALNVALSIRVLYISYLINGGIAMLATGINWYNIFVALPLLVVAVIISQLETQYPVQGAVIFELGGYQLDQDIRDIKSQMQDCSQLFGSGPFERMFSDEKIIKVNQVDFLGETWECILGVTNNKIYKIVLSGIDISNIFEIANKHFLELYGKPTERQNNIDSNINIWDLATAYLVISQYQEPNVVNIIATSKTPLKKTNPNLLVPK
jgi:predicted nucleic-acid-binding Zn-ribbon protein